MLKKTNHYIKKNFLDFTVRINLSELGVSSEQNKR